MDVKGRRHGSALRKTGMDVRLKKKNAQMGIVVASALFPLTGEDGPKPDDHLYMPAVGL